ncbi:MAG: PD40 domain-containing protein [Planctomycetes bacterium]|nr:PD40 domain-containing protein [Planctomycetota bacterium]
MALHPPVAASLALAISLAGCHPLLHPMGGRGDKGEPRSVYDNARDAAGAPEEAPGPAGVPYRQLRRDTLAEVGEDVEVSVAIRDGEPWMVFASSRHVENEQLYLQKARARTVTLVPTFPESRNIQPRFHPSGTRIAFASDARGNWDIYTLELAPGSTPRLLTRDDADEVHPSWSPDGQRLAYSAYSPAQAEYHIWVLDTRTGFATDIGAGLFPEWSPATEAAHPTRDKLVFQADRRRGARWSGIWTVNLDGTQRTEILSSDAWGAINPSWNPRGDRIVFAASAKRPERRDVETDADDIWVVDVDGNNLTRITYDPEADWDPLWAADGRIYFSSGRGGKTNIWSLEPVDLPLLRGGLPRPESLAGGGVRGVPGTGAFDGP